MSYEYLPGELEAAKGETRGGLMFLRNYDEGIVRTMGARLARTENTAGFGENYFLIGLEGASQPPDAPGIPIYFGTGEDVFNEFRLPAILVTRGGIEPALQRYHPHKVQYRAPAPGARRITLGGRVGWTKYVERAQSIQLDLVYTVRVFARRYGGGGISKDGNAIFEYLAQIWHPHAAVQCVDTAGYRRAYYASVTYGTEDEVVDVTMRTVGHSFDITIQADLDYNPEKTFTAVTSYPTVTIEDKDNG